MHKQPNIIFLMTDQQRWDCIGQFNRHIHTPTLDKLAESGIVYNQAVCQAPMCVPSRNSMMFGYYPSQIGVRTNYGGLADESKLPSEPLPELLRRAGYQTAGFGKTHWNHAGTQEVPSSRGFEIRAVGLARDSGHYEDGAVMMGDSHPERLLAYHEETKDYGGGEENANGYIGATSRIPMNHHRDGWVAEQCLDFIEHGLDPSRPLFLYLSFLKPHAGFNVPDEFERLYRLEDIPDTPQPPWSEEENTHLAASDAVNASSREAYLAKKRVWQAMSPLERRRTTLRYWANCSWLDHYFGLVLTKLEQQGALANSLIVFVSDHGEMLGERQFRFTKYCLYESSVRVPMILSGTYVPADRWGTIDERPAELVDLIPTLAKAAGLPANPMLPGLDLFGEEQRGGSFCEFHGKGVTAPHSSPAYMWRTKAWKLILYVEGAVGSALTRVRDTKGEMYSLTDDPNEWINLYDEEAYAQVREQMKTELLMHLAIVWAKGPNFYDKQGTNALRPGGD
ncbi:arylsulfatase A-like enzyme [Paenibacillus phyllosphaerae]|uniref:Arylsulfatase A-like enzyme n=1 Tax=Paenibacillus phyllosphaerae TaxID=274593 RepID=A0A7W5AWY4_9BACL|nr:sulfatase-like hydrolase/transferase [Paenibacillus phyllosphaerae]MBB3110197.1 arylsulfatase A-like enzyme [Paenibacillus phyllosphaerae]